MMVHFPQDPAIPLLCPDSFLYVNVHSSRIHKSPRLEITPMSINWGMHQQIEADPNKGLPLGTKE